ncbi:MAG: hypothetical protein P4L50_17220 [Anaerolineaceae bacterium]|nr:hypothetical protein [Anaerolineaceae bacterium]
MIIHEPEINFSSGEITVQARIETQNPTIGLPDFLWFKYPERYQKVVSNRADAFLSSMILLAMVVGEDLEVRGNLSPRLFYAVDEYQQIFSRWLPHVFTPIQIHPEKLVPAPFPEIAGQYASTFSGGVDSFFTLKQSLFPEPGKPAWPIRYGLFINGTPDIPLIYPQKFEAFKKQYTALFDEVGLELIPARTNLMQFSANRIAFNPFLEAPILGCAMGLSPLLSGVFMPSGRMYERYRLTATGPITAHLLCTEAFEPASSGAAFTRIRKIQSIADWAPVQKYLRVCFGFTSKTTETNCSHCSKCMRTRMDLNVLGKLQNIATFEHSFGLKDYIHWGRWIEVGFGFETETLAVALKERKELVPLILIGLVIGYTRYLLRRFLPIWIKKQIFKISSEGDPHQLFAQDADS